MSRDMSMSMSMSLLSAPDFDWLDGALAIEASARHLVVGGIGFGEPIRPVSLVACHFREAHGVINQAKLNHLSQIAKHSQRTLAICSSDSPTFLKVMTDKVTNGTNGTNGIEVIIDENNCGLDFGKWLRTLNMNMIPNQLDSNTWFWLTNDSWFSCRPLDDLFVYYGDQSSSGLIGLTDNSEHRYHLQSYSWLLKGCYLPLFRDWNTMATTSNLGYHQTIIRCEVGFCQNLLSRGIWLDSYYSVAGYHTINHFANRPSLLASHLDQGFPLVKWRFFVHSIPEETWRQFHKKHERYFYSWLESMTVTDLPPGFSSTIYAQSAGLDEDIKTGRHYRQWGRKQLLIDYGQSCRYLVDLQYLETLSKAFRSPILNDLRPVAV